MLTKDYALNGKPHAAGRDTRDLAGFRTGTASSYVIGRKLERLYGAPPELPRELDTLLQALDRKLSQAIS